MQTYEIQTKKNYQLPTNFEKEPTDEEIATIQKELDEKEKLINEILCYYKKCGTERDINKTKNELILKDNKELIDLVPSR
jgi:hypothetical protein